jgi:hypothetical protein
MRVWVQSFLTASIGVAVYSYMTKADIGYLDLERPVSPHVFCLARGKWPIRRNSEKWIKHSLSAWNENLLYRTNATKYAAEWSCPSDSWKNSRNSCSRATVPLLDMRRNLGYPFRVGQDMTVHSHIFNDDALEWYAFLFLYHTVFMWGAVVVHDLALLRRSVDGNCSGDDCVPDDISGINRRFPFLKKLLFVGTGWKHVKRKLCSSWAWRIFLVPWILWSICVLFFVFCPALFILSLRFPVRLVRVQLLSLCVDLLALSLILMVRAVEFMFDVENRPAYAITWASDDLACDCGCVYPIAFSSCFGICLVCAAIIFRAVMLGLKCLKGLRRKNWANLLTVSFAVPVNMYPVRWKQPDGQPIMNRKVGEPVQDELAFDPFALMDEQPESGKTLVNLTPSFVDDADANAPRENNNMIISDYLWVMPLTRTILALPSAHSGGQAGRSSEANLHTEGITKCCGFPYRTKRNDEETNSGPSATEPPSPVSVTSI